MPIGVGVIGAGTVGGGVIETLLSQRDAICARSNTDLALVHVADKNTEAFTAFDLGGVTVSDDAGTLIDDPNVHIVCELIGGIEPARSFILRAIDARKHVVTANKMLIATHGPELCRAAIDNNVELRYEAAVAGGIPIIEALRRGLAANDIQHVYGILNGTCNYILTRMTYDGLEFDEALRQAQAQGFAETPPDLDIQGHDTAHKCQIIASLCYCTEIDLKDIYVEGVTTVTHADVAYARELGYIIKLLAIVRKVNGEIEARVHPTLVPNDYLLAAVRDELNAIFVQGDIVGPTLYYGRGAGRFPTASAVVADIIGITSRGVAQARPAFIYNERLPIRDIGGVHDRFYLRLKTQDKPGVLGHVCTVLGEHGVSIASVIQKELVEEESLPAHIVMMTHETREADLRKALAAIDRLDFVLEPTHVLHVLSE